MITHPDATAAGPARTRRILGDAFYRVVAASRPWIAGASPRHIVQSLRTKGERRTCEQLLAELSTGRRATLGGPVLVDGTWDNPNYWLRYSLFRAALGLSEVEEIGIVGPSAERACRGTFRALGVREVVDFDRLPPSVEAMRAAARALLAGVRASDDILECKLPFDFPAAFLYDGILKRQRRASVDIGHGRLEGYVVEALRSLYAADRLLSSRDFELVVLSHAINFRCGALAWRAAQLGIPTVVLFGTYGVCRFYRIETEAEIFEQVSRPSGSDIDALTAVQAKHLAAVGWHHLAQRRQGRTDDLGGVWAFRNRPAMADRDAIVRRFGWDATKPLVAVYAPSFFDYPHVFGMSHFRDIAEWLLATRSMAEKVTDVNWLFRAHPCDDWYGGAMISDVLPPFDNRHMALSPDDWNSAAVQDSADAVITYSGTVGIEAAAFGKPVLIADRGWYHDCGFVKWPKSREEYLHALEEPWWREIDLPSAQERARIFAGWYFCCPDWQGDFVTPDDRLQDHLYGPMPKFLSQNRDVMEREIVELRKWMGSDERMYHSFKITRAEYYKTSNVIGRVDLPPPATRHDGGAMAKESIG